MSKIRNLPPTWTLLILLFASANSIASNLPPHLFLGTDAGWGSVSPYTLTEGTRSGMQFDLKGHGSFYWSRVIWDVGMGWQFGKRSGDNLNNTFSKTITRGAFLESSLRYGNPSGWQLGPVIHSTLVGDVGLGDGRLIESQAKKSMQAGLQLMHESPKDGYRIRFGGRWMTDLNIEKRTEHVFQASFQIGWPVPSSSKPKNRRVRRAGYQIVQKDRSTQKVKIVLDARRIEFDYDQATLRPEAQRRLANLGKFLALHRDKWDRLMISGHTDERGSFEYNQKLSENRATSVKMALGKAGVAREKMESRGFSESAPIDPGHNEYAWQRNRRVEFEFSGVQDLELIIDGVNQSTSDDQVDEETY
jgi:outer membrane protein OmpA-like peptidoglycan-associated protein